MHLTSRRQIIDDIQALKKTFDARGEVEYAAVNALSNHDKEFFREVNEKLGSSPQISDLVRYDLNCRLACLRGEPINEVTFNKAYSIIEEYMRHLYNQGKFYQYQIEYSANAPRMFKFEIEFTLTPRALPEDIKTVTVELK